MTIAKDAVTVSADDWEALKATFMLITNSVDSEMIDAICENAIAAMDRLQEMNRLQETEAVQPLE